MDDRPQKRVNYATQLQTIVDRILDNLVDEIAKEGLNILKKVLDHSGFAESEYLKNYEIYAHVVGHYITYEILLDISAVDEVDQKKIEEAKEEAKEAAERAQEEMIERAARSYGIVKTGPARVLGIRDARTPAKDARQDVRKNARDRLIEHEIAAVAPRSLTVKRSGKISLQLKRSMREVDSGFVYPKRNPEGIIQDFFTKLVDLIKKEFVPEFEKAMVKYES